MRRFWVLIVALLIPLIPLGLFALGVIRPPQRAPSPVALTIWTVTDTAKAYESLIADYNNVRPYISVTVVQQPRENYAELLKDAWSRGRGPDIFELPAASIGEFADDYLAPVPPVTNVFTYVQKKILLRNEVEIRETSVPSVTIDQLRRDFVDVVSDDVVRKNLIYGLPLTVDTLVLYYNRDLLRSANVVEPPKTWSQLIGIAPKLSVADAEGSLLQSAIALGTAANVDHAADSLSLLMLQDGVTLQGPNGSVLLDESYARDGTNLGENALTFYTSFANPGKSVYSWSKQQPRSIDAFIQGRAAMVIGYASDRPTIEAANSVNFGVAPIPHLQEDGRDALLSPAGVPLQVNFGNYWVLSVFQRSPVANEAWNFIQYIAKQERLAKQYLGLTGRIGALRSIVAEQTSDPELQVFAEQAISARSWYHGRDAAATTDALNEMIDTVADGTTTVGEALNLARRRIELTTRE